MKLRREKFIHKITGKSRVLITATCSKCGYFTIDWVAKLCRESQYKGKACPQCESKRGDK